MHCINAVRALPGLAAPAQPPSVPSTPATQDISQIAIARMSLYFTPQSEYSHFCVLLLQVPSVSLTNTLQMLLVLS